MGDDNRGMGRITEKMEVDVNTCLELQRGQVSLR